jgi:hypothetical protein
VYEIVSDVNSRQDIMEDRMASLEDKLTNIQVSLELLPDLLTRSENFTTFILDRDEVQSQSKELTRVSPRVSSALSFIGGVHIGARALLVLNLIWFG